MTSAGRRPWRPILVAAAAAMTVAALGTLATDLGPWYRNLEQPSWKPPDALFGPAWTLIYIFVVLSAAYAWRDAPTKIDRHGVVALYCLNALLNVLWSVLFFRFQRPDWALIEVVLFWLSILIIMIVVAGFSRMACAMLLPYLAWVAFAGWLNLAVLRLNPSF